MERGSQVFSLWCMFAFSIPFVCSVHSSNTSDAKNDLSKSDRLVKATERLRAKCDALSILPNFREDFLPTDPIPPKYDNALDKAQAVGDLRDVFKEINKFISDRERELIRIRIYKPAKFSPSRLWHSAKLKQTRIETAITYAYYTRAKKLVEAGEIVAALADVFYVRNLRTKQKGVSLSLVNDLEITIRNSIKSACEENIDRLFALESPELADLEHAYARLKDFLRVQPPYDECHFLKDDLKLINDILDRAYLIKHSSLVESDDESTVSDLHSPSSDYISPDDPPGEYISPNEQQDEYEARQDEQSKIKDKGKAVAQQSASTSSGQGSQIDFSRYIQFEKYMMQLSDLLKALRESIDNKNYKDAMRQCDEIISDLQDKTKSLKLDGSELARLNRAQIHAQFYKVYSLNVEKRFGDACKALNVLKQMQIDSGIGIDKRTLDLERTILRNFYSEP